MRQLSTILVIVCTTPCISQTPHDSLLSLLPAPNMLQEWSMVDSVRVYEGDDLYQFIDGGADLFLEYGFQRAAAAEYQHASGNTINLEVYEMSDAGAAFGIYSVRSGDGAIAGIGQGGIVHPHYVTFWKDRFYVSVAASDSTVECRSSMDAIARAIDRSIAERGQIPNVVELLPPEDLQKRQYVRGRLGLSLIRVLDLPAMFPILDGAIGTYRDHTLMIVRYENAADARERRAAVARNFASSKRFRNFQSRKRMTSVVDGSNRTICLQLSGVYLILSVSVNESVAVASCQKAVSLVSRE